jgi:hypothetical protein
MHLPAQHRDLMPQHEQFDVLRTAVAGELGQHLQDLAQEQVHQRSRHGSMVALPAGRTTGRNRTSQPPNRIYEPYTLQPLPEPSPDPATLTQLRVRRHDRLGGLLHEYENAA